MAQHLDLSGILSAFQFQGQVAAQNRARRDAKKAQQLQTLGTLGGAAIGAFLGPPGIAATVAAAQAGAGIGSTAGSLLSGQGTPSQGINLALQGANALVGNQQRQQAQGANTALNQAIIQGAAPPADLLSGSSVPDAAQPRPIVGALQGLTPGQLGNLNPSTIQSLLQQQGQGGAARNIQTATDVAGRRRFVGGPTPGALTFPGAQAPTPSPPAQFVNLSADEVLKAGFPEDTIVQRNVATNQQRVVSSAPGTPSAAAITLQKGSDIQTVSVRDPDFDKKVLDFTNQGYTKVIQRSDLSAAERRQVAETGAGLDSLENLKTLFKPEFVGPLDGRKLKAKMVTGVGLTDEEANFAAANAALENEIIKLMSGAAVSGSEEVRMRRQIPQLTDPDKAWQAKLKQTQRNKQSLLRRIQSRGGTAAPAESPLAGQTGTRDFSKMPAAELGRVDTASLSEEEKKAVEKRLTELGF